MSFVSRSLRPLAATWLLAALTACPAKQATPPSPPPSVRAEAVSVDGERVLTTITDLASDGLGGRYSLHRGDIGRAAGYIAKAFEAAGVDPVGSDYRHAYPILVGAEIGKSPTLRVTRRKRTHDVPPDAFAPLSVSASGTVEGEVVFVGYAAQAEADGDRRSYDDLAGLDLQGKIALVLLDAPGRPNPRTLYRALRQVRDAFEERAKPLRDAGDVAALAKLHKQSRDELAALVGRFLKGNKIDAAEIGAPEDPTEPLPLEPFTDPVFAEPADRTAPAIQFREGRLRTKLKRLQAAGAVAAIVVRGQSTSVDSNDELPKLDGRAATAPSPIPIVQMRWRAADKAFRFGRRSLSQVQAAIDRTLKPHSKSTGARAELSVEVKPLTVEAPNVLATIPGAETPDEVVMLGAHFDHIGTDEKGRGECRTVDKDAICNGADDNASGTAVVLEVARVIAASGRKPKRTLVFALFSGEELGLHGSRALATTPPAAAPFAEGKVVAMINIDMVGRLREQGLMIGGVGSSPAWMKLFEEVGTFGIPTVYDRSITTRSDHANFYRQDVPVVFLFTGTHEDYHRPGDEVALINRDGLAQITELTHAVVRRLADGYALPFAKPQKPSEGLVGALPGDNPESVEKRVGF